LTIPDEQVPYGLTAVEHYVAYMRATAETNVHTYEIAKSFNGKPTAKQQSEPSAKRKRG
jgi:hypothetical protein